MEDILLNGIAIIAGIAFAIFLFRRFGKKNPSKQSFAQEYHKIINNPEYKVKGNN